LPAGLRDDPPQSLYYAFYFFHWNIFRKIINTSIHSDTDITAFLGILENLLMLSLSSPYDWSQKLDSCSFFQLHQTVYHLVHCLPADRLSAFRTMRNSNPCIKQTEIIINLRYRSDCGSRISIGGLLINGNRRRQSFNAVYIRFFHLAQKLSCIRRQRFHISALSLCVNRIKRQRGLAGSAQPCQDDKLIPRYFQIDIF